MRIIFGNQQLSDRLESDASLKVASVEEFSARYDELSERFHSYFSEHVRDSGMMNCAYHKRRYIHLVAEKLEGQILDVGNDKPFLSFYLRHLHPEARIRTLSFDIPESPYELLAVDIENEEIPGPSGSIDKVILAEVLEHLWRDPAKAVHEMNKALRMGGEIFVTTPNACELHALTCVLWQANPNQRNQFYSNLESGHLHIWTAQELRILFESNGFSIDELGTYSPYGYTNPTEQLISLVKSISPHFDMMGESLFLRARKSKEMTETVHDARLFPDGSGVQFDGAIKAFALSKLELIEVAPGDRTGWRRK